MNVIVLVFIIFPLGIDPHVCFKLILSARVSYPCVNFIVFGRVFHRDDGIHNEPLLPHRSSVPQRQDGSFPLPPLPLILEWYISLLNLACDDESINSLSVVVQTPV